MFIPIVQKKYDVFVEYDLSGDVIVAKDINLSTRDWFSGVYSQSKEKYLNDNFGFRNFFVRLNDQLHYSLFKKVFAKDVVAGKDRFLYELKYLQAYAGMDYVGDEEIRNRFNKLKFIQDTLEKKGIHFALLFAPSKATFYPEYIPSPYDAFSKKTNYLKYIETAKNTGIHFFDFNKLFVQLKPSMKYPLYPKTGTHWSIYGLYIAFDSLSRYMERVSGKKLSKFDYSNLQISDTLRWPDGDIESGMNTLFDLPHFKMAYPITKWDTANYYKPRVLTVSDSYWMAMYFQDLPKYSFSESEFWYYNKLSYSYNTERKISDLYPQEIMYFLNLPKQSVLKPDLWYCNKELYTYEVKTGNPTDSDLKESLEKNDFVFIMSTEATLKDIGWGFIDDVYFMYKNGVEGYEIMKKKRKKNSEITQIKLTIKNNGEWFHEIEHQAKDKGISIDSSLQLNAEYVFWEKHKNDPPPRKTEKEIFNERVEALKAAIKNSKEWLRNVEKKAEELHISLDSCINMNAKWVAEQEIKRK